MSAMPSRSFATHSQVVIHHNFMAIRLISLDFLMQLMSGALQVRDGKAGTLSRTWDRT